MRRQNKRRNNQPNANRPWTSREIRDAVDDHIRGKSVEQIAKNVKREVAAVRALFDKIESDYDEKGEREPIITRMSTVKSGLDFKRQTHSRMEKGFFSRCLSKLWEKHKNRAIVLYALSAIFHLPPEQLLHLERIQNKGFGLTNLLQ